MSYTMADFRRDYVKEHLYLLTPEERLKDVPPEVLRQVLQERLKALPLEVRLKGLSIEQIERYLKQITEDPSTANAVSTSP